MLVGAMLLGTAWGAQALSDEPMVRTKVWPAVYKSDKGLMQRVWVTVDHEGKAASAILRLGDQSQRVKLEAGENRFFFEVPEVSSAQSLPLTVTRARGTFCPEPAADGHTR